MAPNTATNAAILKVLNRHLKNEPHERAEITTNGAKHEIVSSELDLLVEDSSSSLLAARLILSLRDISNPDGRKQDATELAAHIITTPDLDPSSPSTLVILDDTTGGASQSPDATPTATRPTHRASTIPTHPTVNPPPSSSSLKDTYKSYISTFMSPPPTALQSLPQYLHQPIIHNRRALSIPEYHDLVQTVRAAIPDIEAQIVGLLADQGRGVVAARLEFRGTLVAPFAGVEPPAEGGGGGLAVTIGEIVFYWLEGGRVREVVSLVDLGGMRG